MKTAFGMAVLGVVIAAVLLITGGAPVAAPNSGGGGGDPQGPCTPVYCASSSSCQGKWGSGALECRFEYEGLGFCIGYWCYVPKKVCKEYGYCWADGPLVR